MLGFPRHFRAYTPFNQASITHASLTQVNNASFASTFKTVSTEQDGESGFNPEDYKLQRSDGQLLVSQPWSTKPFKMNSDIDMPIFNFKTGKFTGEIATLDHENFN